MADVHLQALVVGYCCQKNSAKDFNPVTITLQLASQTLSINPGDRSAADEELNLSEELPLQPKRSIDPSRSSPEIPQGLTGTEFEAEFTKCGAEFLPGSIMVKNESKAIFYVQTVKVTNTNDKREWEFACEAYISPPNTDQENANVGIFYLKTVSYLPYNTPLGLRSIRKYDLKLLKIFYGYGIYDDLGFDFKLGGDSPNLPYPRREAGLILWLTKLTSVDGILSKLLRDVIESSVVKTLQSRNIPPDSEFFSNIFQIYQLHRGGHDQEFESALLADISKLQNDDPSGYLQIALKEVSNLINKPNLDFPVPKSVYMPDPPSKLSELLIDDEEFGRQTVAGMHPTVIQRLQSFPRDDGSEPSLLERRVDAYLQSRYALSANKAIVGNKLFIIDYYDGVKRYVREVNKLPGKKMYAPRAVFFSTDEGKMVPVAIELSLPQDENDEDCRLKQVFTPEPITEDQTEPTINWLWELAKIHFSSIDFAYHELVSHWLHSHAVMEPIIVATQRTLSKLHPLHALLKPCFYNTLLINYLGRRLLLNKTGIIVQNYTGDEFAMKVSSDAYRSWRFDKQAVPEDLISRGMATRDPNSDDNVHLIHPDYPFAEDALEVWKVLKTWVGDFVKTEYKSSNDMTRDWELQKWWAEVKEKAHPDVSEGWPTLTSIDDLIQVLTTIFWIAGGHHAAVNFGQYDYAGFVPQRTSVTHQLLPDPAVPKTETEWTNYILETIASPKQTVKGIITLKFLSTHPEKEVYLGQRGNSTWTDKKRKDAFNKFSQSVQKLEEEMTRRNDEAKNKKWSNRVSKKTELFYTLLYPSSGPGMTMQGVPYSTST